MESIGDRIRSRRLELRISQEELAELVGVSQTSISKIESDPTRSTKHVLKFAEVLKCTAEWLQHGDNKEDSELKDKALLSFGKKSKRQKHTVNDQSMVPQFSPGHIVYYQTDIEPSPGDYVVVQIDGRVTIRKYRVVNTGDDSTAAYLIPESEDFPQIKAASADILGVAVEQVIPLTGL